MTLRPPHRQAEKSQSSAADAPAGVGEDADEAFIGAEAAAESCRTASLQSGDHQAAALDLVSQFAVSGSGRAMPGSGSVLGNLLRLQSMSAHTRAAADQRRRSSRRKQSKPASSGRSHHFRTQISRKHSYPPSRDLVQLNERLQRVEMTARMMASAAVTASAACSPQVSARHSSEDLSEDALRRHHPWAENSPGRSGLLTPSSATRTPFGPADQLHIAMTIADLLQKQDYILLLAKSMVMFGAPSHRLDRNLFQASLRLGLQSDFHNFPGFTIISFGDPETHTSETKILRVLGGYHLERLEVADNIARAVSTGECALADGIVELGLLVGVNSRPYWNTRWQMLGWFLASFSATPLAFSGGWLEAAVAACLGLLIGGMSWLASHLNAYADVFELTAALLSALIASALGSYICFWPTVLGATVNLLPGLSLTMAMMELVSKNMVSGAVRLTVALAMAMFLGVGLNLGNTLWRSASFQVNPHSAAVNPTIVIENKSSCTSLSVWWNFLFFPVMMMSFIIYMQASLRQIPAIFFVATVGYIVSILTMEPFWAAPLMIGPALAAFAIGLTANLYARITSRLAVVCVIPAVLMLVPGSFGVKGSIAFMSKSDGIQGLGFVFEMMYISLGIAIGLFVAALVVMPMGKRRRSEMMVV